MKNLTMEMIDQLRADNATLLEEKRHVRNLHIVERYQAIIDKNRNEIERLLIIHQEENNL